MFVYEFVLFETQLIIILSSSMLNIIEMLHVAIVPFVYHCDKI